MKSAAAGLCAEAGAWANAALLASSRRCDICDAVLSNAAINACSRTCSPLQFQANGCYSSRLCGLYS